MTQRFFIIKHEPQSIESLPLVGRTSTRCDGALKFDRKVANMTGTPTNRITHNTGQWHNEIKRTHRITYRNGRVATVVVLSGGKGPPFDNGSGLESSVEYSDGHNTEANVNAWDCPSVKSIPPMRRLLRDGWMAVRRGKHELKPVFVNNYGGDLSSPDGGEIAELMRRSLQR